MYQAGTLSGNPVSVAAGIATLAQLRDGLAYSKLEGLGRRLEDGLADSGVPWLRVRRMGSVAWPFLSDAPWPTRADGVPAKAVARFVELHPRLLDRGLYLPPSAHEVLFLSTAHAEADVDALVRTLREEASALMGREGRA